MKEQLKEELVERFRAYLDTDLPLDDEGQDDFSLFSELSGLKNEVRIESRQVKSALDDFRDTFSHLDSVNQDLAKMLKRLQGQQEEKEHLILQPLVSGLMDLYDRLQAGLELKPPKQNMLQMLLGGNQQKSWLSAHKEGQKMVMGRIMDLLLHCGVKPIEIKDASFDPRIMRAIQLKADAGRPNGCVLKECRKGFMLETRVVRPAEVIVNKIKE